MSAPVSDTHPGPKPNVLAIAPYVGGKAQIPGLSQVFKLSSNESALGPSPKAIAAFQSAADQLAIYPEGSSAALRAAIGEVYGIDRDRIVCGAGSDELLALLVQAYAHPGEEVLYSAHGFLVYKIAALAHGAVPVAAPEPKRIADVDALLAAVTPRTRILFLANPNNPTGTLLSAAEIARLHRGLPANVLLVIDAAYGEYCEGPDHDGALALAGRHANVVTTRTFSKIYGLAALRVGWLYGPEHVVDAINRIRGPFNVSIPGQRAAVAAVQDQAWVRTVRDFTADWRNRLLQQLGGLGLAVAPSHGNFLLIDFPAAPGQTVDDADAFLQSCGLILRRVGAYGLPHSLRLTVGPEEANRRVIEAFSAFRAKAA